VQVSTIEFSLIEVSVLHGLKQGNEVLKEIHKELNVESVEKLLEETAEAREYQRVCFILVPCLAFVFSEALWSLSQEIDNILTNSLSLDEEDAVQEELKELQEETVSPSPCVEQECSCHSSQHHN
jgi:charged multivesicular body protein 6